MSADAFLHAPAWQVHSLLLAYPDTGLPAHARLARRVTEVTPAAVADPLRRFLDHIDPVCAADPIRLAADYVATFDHRKRCCPYLTYYEHGDTRNRGLALLRLKRVYAAAGMRLGDEELPDHLTVMLEFAATAPEAGEALLTEHRAGLELLRLALHDAASPWAHVLDSLCATLPPLAGDEREAIARLAADGPPGEEVGLAPFASPRGTSDPVGARR